MSLDVTHLRRTSVKLFVMRVSRLCVCIVLGLLTSNAFGQVTPLPKVDPGAYLPPIKAGPTIRISLASVTSNGAPDIAARLRAVREAAAAANDLGLLINALNKELTARGGGTMSIEGG